MVHECPCYTDERPNWPFECPHVRDCWPARLSDDPRQSEWGETQEGGMTRHRAAMIGTLVAMATFTPGVTETASAQGAYRIVNENSGMALMPAGGSTTWGTPLFQRPVSSHRSQLWDLQGERGGHFSFRNLRSNLCIHPSEWSRTATGAYLALGRCNTNNGARMWDLTYYGPVATGWQYTIRSR